MTEASKRLIVAATLAMGSQWLLSWLMGFIPQVALTTRMTPLGLLDPLNYLLAACAMAVGGWWAGKRFVPVAVLMTLLLWLAILTVMATSSASQVHASTADNLTAIFKFNQLGLLCSLVAAALGAWLGSRLQRAPAAAAPDPA
ncbi:hypothetical protein [Pseudoxanthomonas dokdonensis]|uniref:Uncharacterized protein n=1 Tax=Pseudoxanthomonas dokdonensis TaxID=344882 RepID=A0A0R0CZS3_9GAMM|nr:hypothetical protein [Pseudoxanthomonas dokdonensis]KRG71914.1 hypothetical protein ABB29_00080 [Pseudoxanthomonas dokdonensis]